MYTFEQLYDFTSVVKHGGFRRASENIFKSQPAISLSIKKLEEFLEFDLFVKEGKRMKLTPQGESFYKAANKIMEENKRALATSKILKLGSELRVRICIDPLLPYKKFYKELKKFKKKFPHTAISIVFESFDIGLDLLEQDECDLALCPVYGSYKNYFVEKIGETNILTVSTNKKLARSKSIKDFENSTQVVLSGSRINNAKDENFLEESNKWQVYDMNAKFDLIAEGIGWGSICDYQLTDEIQNNQLFLVKHPSFAPRLRETFAICHKEKSSIPEYSMLVECAKNSFL